jgi:hypothetical protein
MTRDEAMLRLKRLGLTADVGKEVTSSERRAKAQQRCDAAVADRHDLQRRINKQFGAEMKAIRRRRDQAFAAMQADKFTVWRQDRIGLVEMAKGDTREETFAALENEPDSSYKC